MKHIRSAFALCLTVALLFGCAATVAEESPAGQGAEWTVMLYLCGTDLESNYAAATYNLEEIAQVTPNEEINLVIETGGAREWHAEESLGLDISSERLQRWRYDANGYALVEELPLDNMASGGTLTDFIVWGAENYPAEKYMLVLWDHGGGSLTGLVSDELHNNAIMPLNQLEIALKKAAVPLEAVVMDACMMATLESAQAVRESARYLIASEEVVPGAGTAYAEWLQYLYDAPDCDGARVGRLFCDSVQQKYAELGMSSTSATLTFSVIDLQKIDRVSRAFDRMFEEISPKLADPKEFFKFGYYAQDAQRYEWTCMVDLADLADRLRNRALSNEVAGEVYEAVRDAVVYNMKGDRRSYSNGISFYYDPSAPVYDLDHYALISKSAPYLAFLDAASMSWTAPEWVYAQTERAKDISREDYIVEARIALTEEGTPQLNVTNAPSAVSAVNAVFYQYDADGDRWLTLGEYANLRGDFGEGVFEAEFPEEWLHFDGKICEMGIVDEEKEHILYRVPFHGVDEGTGYNLEFRLAYVYDEALTMAGVKPGAQGDAFKGNFEIYGVWDGDVANSLSLPNRSSIELSHYYGMPIELTRQCVDLSDGGVWKSGAAASETFALDANQEFTLEKLPEGQYAMVFQITDVFGWRYISDVFSIEWDGTAPQFTCGMAAPAGTDP